MTLRPLALLLALLASALPAHASTTTPTATPAPSATAGDPDSSTRNGREIYRRFREGLADPNCAPADTSTRWSKHFAAAPGKLASTSNDVLPLFGYVVDELRASHLPTEYALIPFVESGYKPGARSPLGPAGMWQLIKLTARNHRVPIRSDYDGRLSAVDSTKAAVRYLKTLHGMFAGDWRLAAMAYNAGEYRIFGALRRSGQVARSAKPETLPGIPDITHAYVRKLHALSCLLAQAEQQEDWLRAMDRPVPRLQAVELSRSDREVGDWAARMGQDAELLRRLNPAFTAGRIVPDGKAPMRLLALAPGRPTAVETTDLRVPAATRPGPDPGAANGSTAPSPVSTGLPRTHIVTRGDNLSTLAQRYGVPLTDLLSRNGLASNAVLELGKVLRIDVEPRGGE